MTATDSVARWWARVVATVAAVGAVAILPCTDTIVGPSFDE
jgi:hypothetical protein